MGRADYLKLGDWNALCDRCQKKYKASELKLEWTGWRVCESCWEPRHPQEFLKGKRDDQQVSWTRPDSDADTDVITVDGKTLTSTNSIGIVNDEDKTLVPNIDNWTQEWKADLTGNRFVTLSTVGAQEMDRWTISRVGKGAFTLVIEDIIGMDIQSIVVVEFRNGIWVLESVTRAGCPLGVAGYGDLVKALNPISYWRLGESTGLVAVDEMGVNNGTYTAGVVLGQAGLITGTITDEVNTSILTPSGEQVSTNVDSDTRFDGRTDPFSLLVHFKTTSRGAVFSNLSGNVGVEIGTRGITAGAYRFGMWGSSVAFDAMVLEGDVALNDDVSHTIVVTYDGSNTPSGVRVYVDKQLAPHTTFLDTLTRSTDPNLPWTIGDWPNGTKPTVGGKDDTAIWDRELTPAEAISL